MIKNIGFDDNPSRLNQHLRKRSGEEILDEPVYRCIDTYMNKKVLNITGEIQDQEAFLLYPMSEFRGLFTTDWKTLNIIMATATVIVEGENLEEIGEHLGKLDGMALRPIPKDKNIDLGKGPKITRIRIEKSS